MINGRKKHKVCFIGGTRYPRPLNTTQKKKFGALCQLGSLYFVAFSQDRKPGRYSEQGIVFFLLPCPSSSLLRYVVIAFGGLPILLWCTLRFGVNSYVAQSPYEGTVATLAKLIMKLFGKRVTLVIEAHSNFETSLFMQRSVRFSRFAGYVMAKSAQFAFRHSDILRSISDATQQQLKGFAPDKPIVQFPAWTDMEAFVQASKEQLESERQTVLYVGVIIPRKGIVHLVHAFRSIALEFPQAILKIVGEPENEEYMSQLESIISANKLNDRVEFLLPVPQTELARIMRESVVFVLPSIAEGLGRVVFEAMATGTPVIGSDVDGIPDMVIDGVNGFLIPPGDEEQLADRIRWALSHPHELALMGENAQHFAQEFFSAEKYVQGYEQIFNLAEEHRKQKA